MFNTSAEAPLRGVRTPEKHFGFYDATVDGGWDVRIFTPREELPFAGHPTLGTCQVWLDNGGTPRNDGVVIQECGVGLVTLSLDGGRAAFAAPPLLRGGPTDDELVERLAAALRIDVADIVDSEWIDNGPRWVGVLLDSAEAVLAIEPDPVAMGDLHVGVVGPHPEGSHVALELRAFFHNGGGIAEDPVTGSLNASVAQWMLRTGRISSPYLARQGTALGRNGRVHVHEADGEVWVGGDVVTIVAGTVDL